jgi:hypothetical protein
MRGTAFLVSVASLPSRAPFSHASLQNMAQQQCCPVTIMEEFASRTHLRSDDVGGIPKRYLWTDAFAVCNFLGLQKKDMAIALVSQVHEVLGKHRDDDQRSGWISGLREEEGGKNPTRGGLRIGKPMNERGRFERSDPHLEWEQDGQYLHYSTKWIHALDQTARATSDPTFLHWAFDLARVSLAGFSHSTGLGDGSKALYWKMSIDLSYPLVLSMGQHDALDALITFNHLQATATTQFPNEQFLDLTSEMAILEAICEHQGSLASLDPLGIGGLLCDACKLTLTIIEMKSCSQSQNSKLLLRILEDSARSLDVYQMQHSHSFQERASNRLAFRELGLCIGLHAVSRMKALVLANPEVFQESDVGKEIEAVLIHLEHFSALTKLIEEFWSTHYSGAVSANWQAHQDINSVMLATSLAPDGFLMTTS